MRIRTTSSSSLAETCFFQKGLHVVSVAWSYSGKIIVGCTGDPLSSGPVVTWVARSKSRLPQTGACGRRIRYGFQQAFRLGWRLRRYNIASCLSVFRDKARPGGQVVDVGGDRLLHPFPRKLHHHLIGSKHSYTIYARTAGSERPSSPLYTTSC